MRIFSAITTILTLALTVALGVVWFTGYPLQHVGIQPEKIVVESPAESLEFPAADTKPLNAPPKQYDLPKEEPNKEKTLAVIEQPKKEVSAPEPLTKTVFLTVPFNSIQLTRAGVIQWTNSHREQNGLSTLAENAQLNAAATLKLQDMLRQQYFDHVGPDGREPSDWVDDAGYDYKSTGENLALGGFENDKALVQGWMDSPGHRANILSGKYTEIGVAVGKGVFQGDETWLGVQVFGRPMPNCAEPTLVLNEQIDANRSQLDDIQEQLSKLSEKIENAESHREHNKYAEQYNELLPSYNNLVDETKNLIAQYNNEIDAYNLCIEQ